MSSNETYNNSELNTFGLNQDLREQVLDLIDAQPLAGERLALSLSAVAAGNPEPVLSGRAFDDLLGFDPFESYSLNVAYTFNPNNGRPINCYSQSVLQGTKEEPLLAHSFYELIRFLKQEQYDPEFVNDWIMDGIAAGVTGPDNEYMQLYTAADSREPYPRFIVKYEKDRFYKLGKFINKLVQGGVDVLGDDSPYRELNDVLLGREARDYSGRIHAYWLAYNLVGANKADTAMDIASQYLDDSNRFTILLRAAETGPQPSVYDEEVRNIVAASRQAGRQPNYHYANFYARRGDIEQAQHYLEPELNPHEAPTYAAIYTQTGSEDSRRTYVEACRKGMYRFVGDEGMQAMEDLVAVADKDLDTGRYVSDGSESKLPQICDSLATHTRFMGWPRIPSWPSLVRHLAERGQTDLAVELIERLRSEEKYTPVARVAMLSALAAATRSSNAEY